jgi:hypothetical protein
MPANQGEFVFSEAAQIVFGKAAQPDEVLKTSERTEYR